ncbi:hypothetical protein DLAC_03695 [Tieghemostelium lacteum]|uniref:Potassium channel domain-containing protein n=1 Tax=Tieghemostelium lacteum TaxID=361077 RepID=A0A152A0H0_TIELA|nr:hypothetical protein DLAC_03695 [Tieghemostelium lacteum]|eukprot:KYQ99752.1 hypothetical protein DLAC_03695 [Tieghemostelium lacteum]
MSRRKLLINLHKIKDESEIPMLEESSNFYSLNSDLQSDKTDRILKLRYMYIVLNGLFGVLLMILELQVSWTGTTLEINKPSKIIRAVIFSSTMILLIQLIDYYRVLISEVTHGWLTKRARGFRVTPINVLKSTTLAPLFWGEMIVCLAQPLPFVSGDNSWWKDPKWGLLMWLRLYMIARLIRDFSTIYNIRATIIRRFKNEIPPKFNWSLSFKSILFKNPLSSCLLLSLAVLLITSHIIYVFEREANANFTFAISFYISFLSMATGWPTDTYDEYNPSTFFGRVGAIMSCVLGLLLLAVLVENFSRLMQANSHQKPLLNHITLLELQEKEKESAARLIQTVWKRWKWQNSVSISHNRSLFNLQEANFCVKYIEYVKTFSRTRRLRKQFQAQITESSSSSESKQAKLMSARIENLEDRIKAIEDNQNQIQQQLSNILQLQQFQIQQQQQFQNQNNFYQQPPPPSQQTQQTQNLPNNN